MEIHLSEDRLGLNEVVVIATRYGVSRKGAPVIVNVISQRIFNATQSIAMSESLNFQPGVRLETNCQNCGFTQVRMNGLGGGYSQILINSRPVFSALNSVYGLDQIPTNMVDRIEIVRSGGSALYGSNAIAGTINVITKDPATNTWEIGNSTALIDGDKLDNNLTFNASLVNEPLSSGVTFYGTKRSRQGYDANGDGFTEITKLENNTFGTKAFYKPTDYNKLVFDFSAIKEVRRGGDRLEVAPHFTDITEQLDHNTVMGGLTFEQYSRDYRNKLSIYASGQHTYRNSYYGGLGGGRETVDSVLASNAYGVTRDLAVVGGAQFTRTFANEDVLTAGLEHQTNQVADETAGYNRMIDQQSNSTGIYAQYEWKPVDQFKALIGARYDHVDIDGQYTLGNIGRTSDATIAAFSPRLTLLYDITEEIQFRGGYARGFRAPQAFNEDMHVSSVGGKQQFILIGEDVETEYSNAYTGSLNFMKDFSGTQVNILIEGFYTDLRNPFSYVSRGSIGDNLRLEQMVNGEGAYVAGANIELSVTPTDRFSVQAGGTLQQTRYKEPQELFEGADGDPAVFIERFVRTPNNYGYLNANWKPTDHFGVDLTGVYTGTMIAPHVVRKSGYPDLVNTPQFVELNLKFACAIHIRSVFALEISAGIQNAFNSYQKDFDSGASRDSDYIYGPARPRTYFVGLKIGDLH